MTEKPSIFLFFPVFNEENTIADLVTRAREILPKVAKDYSILVVDDGSNDRSGEIAEEFARKYPEVSVVHHGNNLGYGRSLQTGFSHARGYDWVCFTDGDGQYNVRDLERMSEMTGKYDMVISFRRRKVYGMIRVALSALYNRVVRFLFRSSYRDIGSGLKMLRTKVLDEVSLSSTSPFASGEIVLKAHHSGYLIGEVGIDTYPRGYGRSRCTSIPNLARSVRDLLRVYYEIGWSGNGHLNHCKSLDPKKS